MLTKAQQNSAASAKSTIVPNDAMQPMMMNASRMERNTLSPARLRPKR